MTTHPDPVATSPDRHRALSIVLLILGVISAFVAVNVAFGGLETLGLQGPSHYFQVTDPDAFAIRDSHARFYAGVYLGIAVTLVVGSRNVARYRQALLLVFGLIFLGGLARLTQLDPGVTFGADLAVSTQVELVGMPLLAVWVARATRPAETVPVASRQPVEAAIAA